MSENIDWLHSHTDVCKVDLYSPKVQKEQDRKVVRCKMTPTTGQKGLAYEDRYPGTWDRLMEGDSVISPSNKDQYIL